MPENRLKTILRTDWRSGKEDEAVKPVRARNKTVRFSSEDAVFPQAADFNRFFDGASKSVVNDYFTLNKVINTTSEFGKEYRAVTRNTKILDKPDGDLAWQKVQKPGKKNAKFSMVNIFSDKDLYTRLGFTDAQIFGFRGRAVDHAVLVAAEMQAKVRQLPHYKDAVVNSGEFVYSWKNAREMLKAHAARYTARSVSAHAEFIGDKVFIYGEEDRNGWRVFSSVRVAWLALLVHRVASVAGCEAAVFALGPELALLNICIIRGREVISPSKQNHAGAHELLPAGHDALTAPFLSSDVRAKMVNYKEAFTTVFVNGEEMATSVRVSSRATLVSGHLLNSDDTVGVDRPEQSTIEQISGDMWAALKTGPEVAWLIREPVKNEKIFLCYRRHQHLEVVGPFILRSYTKAMLQYTKTAAILPGMSGAAILAVKDMAFLGIHDGTSVRSAIGLRYSAETHAMLWSHTSYGSEVVAFDTNSGVLPATVMRSRGLGMALKRVLDNVTGLYDRGKHVGVAINLMSNKVLVVHSDQMHVPSLKIFDNRVRAIKRHGLYLASLEVDGHTCRNDMICRKPVYGEKVALFGRDKEGIYSSANDVSVIAYDYDQDSFVLSNVDGAKNFPFVGAAVISMRDGSLLGVVVRCDDLEQGTNEMKCVHVDISKFSVQESFSIKEAMSMMVPYAKVDSWNLQEVDQMWQTVCSSARNFKRSNMNKMVSIMLRSKLYERCLANDLPEEVWEAYVDKRMDPRLWASVLMDVDSDRAVAALYHDSGGEKENDEELDISEVYSRLYILLYSALVKYEVSANLELLVDMLK